jgi:crotonobetainyl-CoA:carnitine CoA-transferase CaiB-like acyl-CoA transferase
VHQAHLADPLDAGVTLVELHGPVVERRRSLNYMDIKERTSARRDPEAVFGTQTAIRWRRCLDAAGVPAEIAANTCDGETVLFDEDSVKLRLVAETRHAQLGRVRQVGNLIRFSHTPSTVLRPPPIPGQHTVEIMLWLGHDQNTINSFQARRVIAAT